LRRIGAGTATKGSKENNLGLLTTVEAEGQTVFSLGNAWLGGNCSTIPFSCKINTWPKQDKSTGMFKDDFTEVTWSSVLKYG
jgi:hypothetical protein